MFTKSIQSKYLLFDPHLALLVVHLGEEVVGQVLLLPGAAEVGGGVVGGQGGQVRVEAGVEALALLQQQPQGQQGLKCDGK